MPNLYPLIRPVLRRLPAEAARDLTLRALEAGAGRLLSGRRPRQPEPPILAQRLWDLDFANPVGLAAGYDKDGRVPDAMFRLGFGFVEVGTVTPRPQPGNPKPRVFRLEADRAIINRMGFNSGGLDAVVERLARRPRTGIIGVNLGTNCDTGNAVTDYELGIRRTARFADYLVINVSSPNTPGLRELQRQESLRSLLRSALAAREETGLHVPMLVKIAPDLTIAEREEIAAVVMEAGVDGLIISNTTVGRPAGLASRHTKEAGGLSGSPLFVSSTALLRDMYCLTRGRLPLIGVGGIDTGSEAYAKIRAGACLLQLYTALVFDGPALVGRIKQDLAELLRRDGFTSITEAIGAAHRAQPANSQPSMHAEPLSEGR